jgi:DNA polymerase III epsilon subunit-like protein
VSLIVLDLEYNQPSRRIIQIGAVWVRPNRGLIQPFFCEDVNPREPLNPYISELTGITPERAEQAETLDNVVRRFWRKAASNERVVIGGWGDDARKLVRDSHKAGVITPRVERLDLSALWQLLGTLGCDPQPKSKGLKRVMRYYDVDFDGAQHDALVDARATAEVLLRMAQEAGTLLRL